jgi:glycosyltransferase involved in cell wall biosynthesis
MERTAEQVASAFARHNTLNLSYFVEPVSNIAFARNRAVSLSRGNFLAFIDDDELPIRSWLANLFECCKTFDVDGVLGPVIPHFESDAPEWLLKAGLYDRPRHHTGFLIDWRGARTGNVMIRRRVIEGLEPVFDSNFGTGGEDQDFFRRMIDRGHKFIWCDEAPVYETVPPHRWQMRFLLKRALLRGGISLKHPSNRIKNIAKSLLAVPAYGVALPFLFLGGRHVFLKYLVKLFDHAGRLLGALKLNPVVQRNH